MNQKNILTEDQEYISLEEIKSNICKLYQIQLHSYNNAIIKEIKYSNKTEYIFLHKYKLENYNLNCILVNILLNKNDLQIYLNKYFLPILSLIISNDDCHNIKLHFGLITNNLNKIITNTNINGKFAIYFEINNSISLLELINENNLNNTKIMEILLKSTYNEKLIPTLRSLSNIYK